MDLRLAAQHFVKGLAASLYHKGQGQQLRLPLLRPCRASLCLNSTTMLVPATNVAAGIRLHAWLPHPGGWPLQWMRKGAICAGGADVVDVQHKADMWWHNGVTEPMSSSTGRTSNAVDVTCACVGKVGSPIQVLTEAMCQTICVIHKATCGIVVIFVIKSMVPSQIEGE